MPDIHTIRNARDRALSKLTRQQAAVAATQAEIDLWDAELEKLAPAKVKK